MLRLARAPAVVPDVVREDVQEDATIEQKALAALQENRGLSCSGNQPAVAGAAFLASVVQEAGASASEMA
jgi:hypothetical protein